jgi:hypothetical protein
MYTFFNVTVICNSKIKYCRKKYVKPSFNNLNKKYSK